MLKGTVAGIVLILTIGAFHQVGACECMPRQSPKEALADATAVFYGYPVMVRLQSENIEVSGRRGPQQITVPMVHVQFQVTRVWKGVKDRLIWFRTNVDSRACGYEFVVGEKYLIYAHEVDGALSTGVCSRTTNEPRATDDIDQLGAPGLTFDAPL